MARYGVFYFINTLCFIASYGTFLSKKLCISNKTKNIVFSEILVYFLMLLVNPIYMSSWISTMILLFLPCYLVIERNDNIEKNL